MSYTKKKSAEERQDVHNSDPTTIADELRSLAVGTGDTSIAQSTTTDRTANGRSPVCVTAIGFETPAKKPNQTKTWLDYRLSPMKKETDVSEAIAEARKDGFVEEEIPPIKFRLILFLYGTGFFELDRFYTDQDRVGEISEEREREIREERKNEILEFFDDNKRKKRLKLIAFSPPCDTVPVRIFDDKHNRAFDSYFNFARSCEKLFRGEDSTIGFLGDPYYRIQYGGNCYIVAVATFLSLNLRKQKANQKPIDIGWLARHYVTHTLELLKDRVIDDKGGGAIRLLKSILGQHLYYDACCTMDFQEMQKYHPAAKPLTFDAACAGIIAYLKDGRYGLVSGVEVSPQWDIASSSDDALTKFGYWKVVGTSKESAFHFVELEPDDDDNEQRKVKKALWDYEINIARDRSIIKNEARGEETGSRGTETTERVSEKHKLHAMVLVGSFKNQEGERLFLLQNWWVNMPLVAMSFEYMVACNCKVIFFNKDLPQNFLNGERKVCGLLGAESSHPDYADEPYFDDADEGEY